MKILIVEDELLEANALRQIIQNHYSSVFSKILMAHDGVQAVEVAKCEQPDLILMDINLPVLDGQEAARRILESQPDTKMIMVSAYSDYMHLRQSMRNKAQDYIVKPYSVETLMEAMNRVLTDGIQESPSGREVAVEKVKQYLEAHYAQNISLQDVAKEVNLDKSYLGRIFRDVCGMTVMSCLKEIRLRHAKQMLLLGYGASEVAVATGFGDPAYFSRYFKQEVGCPPTQYRALHQQKKL